MKFNALDTLEQTVANSGNNAEYKLQKFSLPVPGEALQLSGVVAIPAGRSKYYHDVAHPKQRVVLHFTAGNIRSDLSALTKTNVHVSVAFVIGRSGMIYQLFPSKFWSGHIGKGLGNSGTGNAQDKTSIGIELSNYGFLSEKDGNLETYYSRIKNANGKVGPVDVYCSLSDKTAYQKIAAPFRKQSYYATFTPEQYDSLIILLRYLTATFKIPRDFMPEPKRYEATSDTLSFKGIVSHINYRTDGKWDIGPGFDWTQVITGVQAAAYTPVFPGQKQPEIANNTRGGFRGGDPSLNSEDQMKGLFPEAKADSEEDEPYEEVEEQGIE